MNNQNWPNGINYGHSNWTGSIPDRPSSYYSSWAECDGKGGYAKDSYRIPRLAWVGVAVVIALFFGVAHVGAAAGF